MTCFSYLVLLFLLSMLNFVTVIWVWLFDFFSTRTLHKIRILKIGLILLVLSALAGGTLATLSLPAPVFEIGTNSFLMPVEKIASWQGSSEELDYCWVLFLIHVSIFSFLLVRIAYAYFSTKVLLKDSKGVLINGQHVWLNKNLSAPLSFGIAGKIYVPENIERSLGKRKTEMALAHESAHIENHDTVWKLVSLIVQSFLFFAPWAYIFHKKFMLEIETLCDEIARKNTQSDPKEYGSFLLSMAARKSTNFICTNLIDRTLKRRIIAMKKLTNYRPILTSIACFTLILLSGLSVAAIAGPLSLDDDITISSEVFFDGQLISSPVLKTKLNREARIEIGDKDRKKIFIMSVIPSVFSKGQLKLIFNVEAKGLFKAQPYIVLNPNQKGVISIKTDSGKILELRTVVDLLTKSAK